MDLLEKLRQIDPEVQLVEHPTISLALRCTPSQDRYVGGSYQRVGDE